MDYWQTADHRLQYLQNARLPYRVLNVYYVNHKALQMISPYQLANSLDKKQYLVLLLTLQANPVAHVHHGPIY